MRARTIHILLASDRGVGKLGLVLFLALFAAGVFSGSRILPFFYYHEELVGMMESQAAKATVFTDEQIRKTLWKTVKNLEIPIEEPADIKINRVNGEIVIEMEYDEVFFVELPDGKIYDIHVFHFNPIVKHEL